VSLENVEFVLDSYARYNAGERRPELWYWHEDAEYHASSEDPDSDVHRGIGAIRKQFERWEEAIPDLQVEPLEAKESGEQVLLWVRFSGHGAGSGLPIDMELAHVLTLEDGRVRRLEEFTDRAEALKAVGLEE